VWERKKGKLKVMEGREKEKVGKFSAPLCSHPNPETTRIVQIICTRENEAIYLLIIYLTTLSTA
jgi:hypothetical protein